MDSKGKWDPFTISDKINISVQVDACIGMCVELALSLRLSVLKLNTDVKSCEEIERRYVQLGSFSKQQKSLKP
jgi:hypothetical protein